MPDDNTGKPVFSPISPVKPVAAPVAAAPAKADDGPAPSVRFIKLPTTAAATPAATPAPAPSAAAESLRANAMQAAANLRAEAAKAAEDLKTAAEPAAPKLKLGTAGSIPVAEPAKEAEKTSDGTEGMKRTAGIHLSLKKAAEPEPPKPAATATPVAPVEVKPAAPVAPAEEKPVAPAPAVPKAPVFKKISQAPAVEVPAEPAAPKAAEKSAADNAGKPAAATDPAKPAGLGLKTDVTKHTYATAPADKAALSEEEAPSAANYALAAVGALVVVGILFLLVWKVF